MPHPRHPLREPAAMAALVAEYRAGVSQSELVRRHETTQLTIQRILTAAGEPLRSRAEENRKAALEQHDSPLRTISADRWHELYWGGDFPSLNTLRDRLFEMFDKRFALAHIRAVLREHGFHIRTPAEQLRLEAAFGRHRGGTTRFDDWPPEVQELYRQRMSAAQKGKRKSKEHLRKLGVAHRRLETRLCMWCSAPITRRPCLFRQGPHGTFCSVSHANSLRFWRKRHGENASRPLILMALRERLAGGPANLERAEELGATLGATEDEIFEVLMENQE